VEIWQKKKTERGPEESECLILWGTLNAALYWFSLASGYNPLQYSGAGKEGAVISHQHRCLREYTAWVSELLASLFAWRESNSREPNWIFVLIKLLTSKSTSLVARPCLHAKASWGVDEYWTRYTVSHSCRYGVDDGAGQVAGLLFLEPSEVVVWRSRKSLTRVFSVQFFLAHVHQGRNQKRLNALREWRSTPTAKHRCRRRRPRARQPTKLAVGVELPSA
jgi:hypothetical protein